MNENENVFGLGVIDLLAQAANELIFWQRHHFIEQYVVRAHAGLVGRQGYSSQRGWVSNSASW